MKIAVNTRLLIKDKLEGIGWFTYEVLKRITVQHPEHEFLFLFDRPFSDEFIFSTNVTPIIAGPRARHPALFYWWFEKTIPRVLKRYGADVFFSPDGYLSLKSDVKSLAVIHDLNFEHYSEQLPFLVRMYYRYFFPKFAEKATKIVTVSNYSKTDIIQQYGIDESKVDVVYNGVSDSFRPLSETEKARVRNKYTQGAHYFVYVGSLNPRKNLKRLFLAFDHYCEEAQNNFKLVIAGEKMWADKDLSQTFENLKFKNRVVFAGRLQQPEVTELMASAFALTYVSLFEGFGIPIIEAMNCDVPVITSNVTSMPEVAGNAALLVDPGNIQEIKEGLLKLTNDELLRNNLIEKGRKQAMRFNWDKTAENIWNCLEVLN